MNIKKRGLGKTLSDLGLGALLGDLKTPPTTVADVSAPLSSDAQLKKLPIDIIKPGKYQPRKMIAPEALEELANSIRTQGVIQPIVVRPTDNNQYEIIAGERRWRAAKLAELEYIPAIVRDISDETAMIVALIENMQRRDLNVMEEAQALNLLMTEFEMTHQAVAEAVGKSRVTVTNILRLLKLSPEVSQLLQDGQLEMGHARALLTLMPEQQAEVANRIVARQLSVRETEDLLRKMSKPVSQTNLSTNVVLHTLQDRLKQKLNLTVSISQNAKGRGKLVIQYNNENELENLIARIH
ncbi:MAG TPA: ParB/RepB/Spo0J family partition protein [Coxiellaceae bacterium]|nr:ParB/RepB/Spo0J family partition protein [Coxiellaceae bacterium]